jgi:subtilisin-like proprotein convertase family protein
MTAAARAISSLGAFALLLCVTAGSAPAATNTYSSGPLAYVIGPSAAPVLKVRDRGPVSRVSVAVRIDFAGTGDLKLALRSPSGTSVVLAANRGARGRNFGTGRGCGGQLTVFADDFGTPIREGEAPFGESPYLPEQALARFKGEQAAGFWTLEIENQTQRRTGFLRCWQLTVSRNVVEHRTARRGAVAADLSYRETNSMFFGVHMRITRAGRTGLDASLGQLNCRECPNTGLLFTGGPNPLTVRDLDFDREPEVLLDLYTGGAHCCAYTLMFRYRPRFQDYRRIVGFWGNVGYRLLDIDRDGRPELVSADDRFSYTFAAYAASVQPLQIWHYDRARLVDVTGSFRGLVEREAGRLWQSYLAVRRSEYPEVRGILAAYLADLYRLGRQGEGWRRIEEALQRGELGPDSSKDGWPAGRSYIRMLRAFLRQTGYAT